jgi:hypothetical protein
MPAVGAYLFPRRPAAVFVGTNEFRCAFNHSASRRLETRRGIRVCRTGNRNPGAMGLAYIPVRCSEMSVTNVCRDVPEVIADPVTGSPCGPGPVIRCLGRTIDIKGPGFPWAQCNRIRRHDFAVLHFRGAGIARICSVQVLYTHDRGSNNEAEQQHMPDGSRP